VGGLRIDEPAVDLGITAAVASSFKNMPVDKATVVIGEVGLTGEVRAVGSIDRRIAEAVKLGFNKCIVPANNIRQIDNKKAEITGVKNLAQAMEALLGG